MPKPSPVTGGAPAPGTLIGDKYLVGDVIATGGMGCLVKAEHVLLKRQVAIKFVLARSGRSAQARLLREARAMRALTSEHVARVFDLGVHRGAPYIVMELLAGVDLRDRVEDDGPMAIADAVDCVLEASAAVAEAHAVGIIHRDLKPANLFLAHTTRRQLVKVLDFGISKVPEPERDDDLHETAEDTVLGTPHFMSPEQLRNPARIDERTDIWALAVTLFFLLTGELPFEGTTRRAITGAIFADDPLDVRDLRPDAPAALAEAIAAALIKRPEERTESIAALVAALVPFASKRGRTAAEQLPDGMLEVPAVVDKASKKRVVPDTTTAAGLSSTLSTTGDKTSSEGGVDDGGSSPRRALALIGAIAAVAIAWVMANAGPAASPEAASESTAPTQQLTSSPIAREDPPPAALEEAPAPIDTTPPAVASSPRRPPTAPPPRATATPRASAHVPPSASASSRPVDIDGLPILD